MFPISSHPAHLFVGDHQALVVKTEHFLQTVLCPEGGCTYCATCRHVRDRQHAQVVWIVPEKQYTRECITPVFELLALQRGVDEHCYIVLQHADFLTAACANALLKSIEEPPPGYQFLLLAASEQMVLPTIRSRCIVHVMHAGVSAQQHAILFNHFAGTAPLSAGAFLRALDAADISERASVELVDSLVIHWRATMHRALKQADMREHADALRIMHLLVHAVQQSPMPGSSKLFWKNLFLQCT
jgi:DNA polymerase III subunit delta'